MDTYLAAFYWPDNESLYLSTIRSCQWFFKGPEPLALVEMTAIVPIPTSPLPGIWKSEIFWFWFPGGTHALESFPTFFPLSQNKVEAIMFKK